MKITGFYLAAPSIVRVNESFSLGIKVLTEPYKVNCAVYPMMFSPKVKGIYKICPPVE